MSRVFFYASCCLCILALMNTGCSATRRARSQKAFSRIVTPTPPPFLTGPAALLLTNPPNSSARIEVESQSSIGSEKTAAGELLVRGSKLVFAPETDELNESQRKAGGYSFIWDVAESRGYVLSEALQGYAPVTSTLHVTNLEISASQAPSQKLSGHTCEASTVTARTADGTAAIYAVLRAADLSGFPIRIESNTNNIPFVLNFSKVRLETTAAAVFSPPEGFTKYPTPEAMADELAARQHNLRRKSPGRAPDLLELEPRRY